MQLSNRCAAASFFNSLASFKCPCCIKVINCCALMWPEWSVSYLQKMVHNACLNCTAQWLAKPAKNSVYSISPLPSKSNCLAVASAAGISIPSFSRPDDISTIDKTPLPSVSRALKTELMCSTSWGGIRTAASRRKRFLVLLFFEPLANARRAFSESGCTVVGQSSHGCRKHSAMSKRSFSSCASIAVTRSLALALPPKTPSNSFANERVLNKKRHCLAYFLKSPFVVSARNHGSSASDRQ
mmetsp:Transcript_88906/g.171078  ORF Transcript_88906/g.171078 Transcript_88906/m.171078 type:complete len:241 (-) Transcript_88906:14-736(-)